MCCQVASSATDRSLVQRTPTESVCVLRCNGKSLQLQSVGRKDPNKQAKGKAIPLQAWKGPEGSRRLRFPDFGTIGT